MSRIPYILYTFYHWLYLFGIPFFPKLLMILNRLMFGAFIPPSCELGKGVRFSYGGCGVVIHSRAKVGEKCIIGTCTTIGGRSKIYNVPQVGNNVYIGSGAKILGDVTIGSNSVIGANAVVLTDVPENCVVAGIPAKIIKKNIRIEDYI